MILNITVK